MIHLKRLILGAIQMVMFITIVKLVGLKIFEFVLLSTCLLAISYVLGLIVEEQYNRRKIKHKKRKTRK